jgi:hypothetical protein
MLFRFKKLVLGRKKVGLGHALNQLFLIQFIPPQTRALPIRIHK